MAKPADLVARQPSSALCPQTAHAHDQLQVLLISTYELGRQPFGLASSAAWLKRAGVSVRTVDLAVEKLPEEAVREADLVGFYVPMHTAGRIATAVARHVRDLKPDVHMCFFGLYAPVNERFFRSLGADTILGGEFEEGPSDHTHPPTGRQDRVGASIRGLAMLSLRDIFCAVSQDHREGVPMAAKRDFFVEFAVDDAERALDFYERVFDWATLSAEGPIEYHVMGPVGEDAVVGILPSAHAPHSLIYFQTDKFDDVVERIQKYGGRIILNQKVKGVGFVAQWIDPHGNHFAATCDRLPAEMAGDPSFITIDPKRVSRRLPNENGRGSSVRAQFVEIATTDARGAVDFYQNVFDWGSMDVEGIGMPFRLAGQIGERAMAGITPSAMGPRSLAYFETDSIGERAQRIGRLGGRVVRLSKQRGVGEVGQFKDPFGNPFGLVDSSGAPRIPEKG